MISKTRAYFGALLASSMMVALTPMSAAAQSKTITEWDLQTMPGAVKVIRDAADRFEAAHAGYKVEDNHILNDAYKTKIKIAFGANQAPCVFSTWGGGGLREYVKSGQVVDLTPYLEKDPSFRDRFLPASFKAATVDGKVYALPAENTAMAVVFYNKELFTKYNLTPPKTWDELMNAISVFKSHNIAPFALANKAKWPGSMFYGYLVDRIGGPSVFANAAERKNGGSFEDPAFIEAGKRLQELVKAGAFQNGFNGADYDVGASRRLLYSGKAAMELMGTWELGNVHNENPEFMAKLGFFAFPSVPGGKGDPKNLLGTLGDNYISVSASCPEKDAAVDLLKTLTDDKAAAGRLADARVMPLKNSDVKDPTLAEVFKLAAEAPNVQLWYDQELSPRLAEVHKDTSQALFGLSATPEQVAKQMEDAAKSEAH